MEKVATSAIDDGCSGEKGSFSNYKLNVYVVGSIPTSQAILFAVRPDG